METGRSRRGRLMPFAYLDKYAQLRRSAASEHGERTGGLRRPSRLRLNVYRLRIYTHTRAIIYSDKPAPLLHIPISFICPYATIISHTAEQPAHARIDVGGHENGRDRSTRWRRSRSRRRLPIYSATQKKENGRRGDCGSTGRRRRSRKARADQGLVQLVPHHYTARCAGSPDVRNGE